MHHQESFVVNHSISILTWVGKAICWKMTAACCNRHQGDVVATEFARPSNTKVTLRDDTSATLRCTQLWSYASLVVHHTQTTSDIHPCLPGLGPQLI